MSFLTSGPTADHLPAVSHIVLADVDQLRAHAAEADRWAADRRSQLVEGGELPPHWQPPYAAVDAVKALVDRAGEWLVEGDPRRRLRAAPALPGRTELVGDWLRDQAAAQMRVVVATDQASRLAELLGRGRPNRSIRSAGESATTRSIALVHGSTGAGFVHRPSNLVLLGPSCSAPPGCAGCSPRSGWSPAISSASWKPATWWSTSTTGSPATWE